MDDFEIQNILCLGCGAIQNRPQQQLALCYRCGISISSEESEEVFQYAAETYYYGYQYRVYYESAFRSSPNVPKPCLAFAGEAFIWVTLAMLSGIIGNVTYHVVKVVLKDLRDQAKGRRAEDKSYSRLADVTDKELDELFQYARDYYQGLESIQKEVRAAIIEEIVVDEISHDPVIGHELTKLIFRQNIKPKHRRKAQELYRIAIARAINRQPPPKGEFLDFWSSKS